MDTKFEKNRHIFRWENLSIELSDFCFIKNKDYITSIGPEHVVLSDSGEWSCQGLGQASEKLR